MTQNGPVVQNVVSVAQMKMDNTQIDLKLIAQKVQNSTYNKKKSFQNVKIRIIQPKSTILVFKSGKMIIIGSESEKDAELAAKKITRKIANNLKIQASCTDFRVTNIVANAEIGWTLDIKKIAQELKIKQNEDYSERLVYKGIPKIKTIQIFNTGKLVFTGATERNDIELAFNHLKKKFEAFRAPKVEKV